MYRVKTPLKIYTFGSYVFVGKGSVVQVTLFATSYATEGWDVGITVDNALFYGVQHLMTYKKVKNAARASARLKKAIRDGASEVHLPKLDW